MTMSPNNIPVPRHGTSEEHSVTMSMSLVSVAMPIIDDSVAVVCFMFLGITKSRRCFTNVCPVLLFLNVTSSRLQWQ